MKRRRRQPPWGRIAGMLTAVLVTLVCVFRRIDPFEIVKRASLTFLVVAIITAVLINGLQTLASTPKRSPH